jgi:hypothetical protein
LRGNGADTRARLMPSTSPNGFFWLFLATMSLQLRSVRLQPDDFLVLSQAIGREQFINLVACEQT